MIGQESEMRFGSHLEARFLGGSTLLRRLGCEASCTGTEYSVALFKWQASIMTVSYDLLPCRTRQDGSDGGNETWQLDKAPYWYQQADFSIRSTT